MVGQTVLATASQGPVSDVSRYPFTTRGMTGWFCQRNWSGRNELTTALYLDDDRWFRLIATRDMTKVVRHIRKTICRGNIEMPEPVFGRNLPGARRARFGGTLADHHHPVARTA